MSPVCPVSVLFSEPKIPQCNWRVAIVPWADVSVLFSEPKIPQTRSHWRAGRLRRFQCSSASRKFLNWVAYAPERDLITFQCSSASRKFLNQATDHRPSTATRVSVLFSEPKIPQLRPSVQRAQTANVSVLFSEPKIPQWKPVGSGFMPNRFQCSSASRKFLNCTTPIRCTLRAGFSALQRAENSSS